MAKSERIIDFMNSIKKDLIIYCEGEQDIERKMNSINYLKYPDKYIPCVKFFFAERKHKTPKASEVKGMIDNYRHYTISYAKELQMPNEMLDDINLLLDTRFKKHFFQPMIESWELEMLYDRTLIEHCVQFSSFQSKIYQVELMITIYILKSDSQDTSISQ